MNREAIEAGLADGNPNVRLAAAALAGLSGDQAWTKSLIELLDDKFWQVRERAAIALGKLGNQAAKPVLMRLLGVDESALRKRVLDILGGAVQEDQSGQSTEQPIKVLRAAALAIANLDQEIIAKPLIQALDTENVNIKIAAIAGLGNVEAHSAVDLLIPCLKDAEPRVRQAAATALGKIRAEAAATDIIKLTEDDSWSVRQEAVIALNHIKAEDSFDALAARLKDTKPEVRRVAAIAVGNTQREDAVALLLPLLEGDQPASVRSAVISSLGGLNAVETLDRVAAGLADPDEGVRTEAAKTVVRLIGRGL